MKKKVTIVLIITILFNALIPNFIYASSDLGSMKDVMQHQSETGQDSATSLFEEGEAQITPSNGKTRTEKVEETDSIGNFLANVLCMILMVPPMTVNAILTVVVINTQDEDKEMDEKLESMVKQEFTIEDVVLGRYTLFDINFFKDTDTTNKGIVDIVRENVAIWYFVLRNIAIAGSLLVLVYIGIRMALSTIAKDQAKYKKMFVSWLTSFILIFVMHYIILFLVNIQETIMDLFSGITEGNGFEELIIKETWDSLKNVSGWNKVPFLILYYMLVYYQVKFFLMYFKRFLSIGFLTIISPLVTITYSIDKAGDEKAQAFGIWLRELIFNIFIQVIHAVIYIVFIFSAAEIAKKIPLLGILFLMTLSRAEKIVKNTFALKGKGFGEEKPLDKIKDLVTR